MTICSAQTDKTDDKRYDLEVKTQKTAKEIVELETRIKGIKGKFFFLRFISISLISVRRNKIPVLKNEPSLTLDSRAPPIIVPNTSIRQIGF